MQKLAEVCIKRPIFAAMIILALVVVGAAAYFRLGVDRFPSVDLPTVRILTVLPGASPEEIETQVSQRLEEAVNTVEGINELRSISGQGRSLLIVTFNLERDIDTAAQDVRDRVATTLRDLPPGTDPPLISKFSNDLAPVLTIALSSPNRSIRGMEVSTDDSTGPAPLGFRHRLSCPPGMPGHLKMPPEDAGDGRQTPISGASSGHRVCCGHPAEACGQIGRVQRRAAGVAKAHRTARGRTRCQE